VIPPGILLLACALLWGVVEVREGVSESTDWDTRITVLRDLAAVCFFVRLCPHPMPDYSGPGSGVAVLGVVRQ